MDRRQFFGACVAGAMAAHPLQSIKSITYLGPDGRTRTKLLVRGGKLMPVDDDDAGSGFTTIALRQALSSGMMRANQCRAYTELSQ